MTLIYVLTALTLVVAIAGLILVLRLTLKKDKAFDNTELKDEIRKESERLNNDVVRLMTMQNGMVTGALNAQSDNIEKSMEALAKEEEKNTLTVEARFKEFNLSIEQKLDKIREENTQSLKSVRDDNEKQLQKMRETVDEKLSSTLEERFNNSFKMVSERLDVINRSFAEMQSLQSGLNDVKKIFSNVKTRGTWGEVALESLLSQILTQEQYAKQVALTKGSAERVDFVVNLPGKNDENVFLPIDSKFPTEDYIRLVEASENGNAEAVEQYSKAIENRIKHEAISIKNKYIKIPKTTDFAILYLPSEGLFAEVLRRPGLVEDLQNNCRVVVCGPTTLGALLNSLQMGFRTVAIEKRSSEIWKLLGDFKKDFVTFTKVLDATKLKLDQASKSIDTAGQRTEIIRKKLAKVETIPTAETPFDEFNLLGGATDGTSASADDEAFEVAADSDDGNDNQN